MTTTANSLLAPLMDEPTEAELVNRLEQVQAAMQVQNLDYYICHCPDNVYYLTNFANLVFERPFILVIGLNKPLSFLIPELERPHVVARSVGNIELFSYPEFPAPVGKRWNDRLQDMLPASNVRIGIEPQCPFSVFQALPGEVVVSDLVDTVRMIKSDFEIGRITYSSQVMSEAHKHLLNASTVGTNCNTINGEVTGLIRSKMLQDNPKANQLATHLIGIPQSPSVSHDPHNFTDSSMMIELGGPHVSVINGTVNGYGAEVERTYFCGHVPEEAKRPFDDMLEARQLALDLTRPGANMSEIDAQVNQLLKSKGYGEYLLHRTGHSFGVTRHEGPFLAEGYEEIIQPRMIFSIEPGIYIPGVGGFRFSDTVVVTEEGLQQLTYAPETLEELTLPLA